MMPEKQFSFWKGLWIELIGFDNTKIDFGVNDLFSRMPVRPQAVSLLIWSTELIHNHTSPLKDEPVGAAHCAYLARCRNEEHERQEWTKFQLRDLIHELHRYGIEVYISFFDQALLSDSWERLGLAPVPQWTDGHPEILYILKNGTRSSCICPWKHLADGTLYEDFFFRQLEALMQDYGFDGLHAADGYAHPRYAVCDADFSGDVIRQFELLKGITVPNGETSERADWILHNCREAWSCFHAERHGSFWRKGLSMLSKHGWKHLFNHCWTRDPLEAKYRYGIDYRVLADAGVKDWVPEAQAAVVETEGWNHSDVPMQDYFRAMIPRVAAYLPGCSLSLLNCIKDGMEQYNVLRHAPAFMDSDIYTISGMLCNGKRAVNGMLTCLADGIRPAEWHRIDSTYQKAFDAVPSASFFPAVVWSDAAFHKEFSAYCQLHFCSSFTLHAKLISQGAVLPEMVRIEKLEKHKGQPLIILNPDFFNEEERKRISFCSGGNYAEIGTAADGGSVFCRLYQHGEITEKFSAETCAADIREISSWIEPLCEKLPDHLFFEKTAGILNRCFSMARAKDPKNSWLRLWGYYIEPDTLKLFAGSEKRTYSRNTILLKGHFVVKEVQTDELVLPPAAVFDGENTEIRLKLPPSGTIPLILRHVD